ncbi:hypothetical protein PVAP13_9NG730700 [Panicum virgatum]|uniref:Uncharacterized protein n=1 Tax=Panicum virgatum TaxID=38727 RepID=A0A8T0N4X3_PANVG|nr:hypothetical protein PVAP13_9NG730700 [Panicum virgatum]
MLAVSASSSFHYCGAGARAQIQTSLYPAIPPANHRSVSGAPNGHAPARHTCSTNFPARSPGARPALPRAMALPRAAIVHPPFSPCPALPACRLSTSTTGSGPSFAYFRTQHPGVGAARRAYPRIEAAARRGARTENPRVRNRRLQKKVGFDALRLGSQDKGQRLNGMCCSSMARRRSPGCRCSAPAGSSTPCSPTTTTRRSSSTAAPCRSPSAATRPAAPW